MDEIPVIKRQYRRASDEVRAARRAMRAQQPAKPRGAPHKSPAKRWVRVKPYLFDGAWRELTPLSHQEIVHRFIRKLLAKLRELEEE